MTSPLILAIDQGTGSTKALLVDGKGHVVARGQCPLGLATPQAGWVEQDAEEIWRSVLSAIADVMAHAGDARIAAIGLSTQRESCVLYDRRTGEALTPLLSWQDQRTLALCEAVAVADRQMIRDRTGLPLDPMFSAVKARWLLDRIDSDRARARAGDIRVSTIDSFLLRKFGAENIIEIGNASRTQLLDIDRGTFDQDLLDLFNVPAEAMPRVVASSGEFVRTRGIPGLPDGIPVTGVMADSHAALFAHGAFAPGKVKATHGTGSSVMGLYEHGLAADSIDAGLCRTIAWQTDAIHRAFEGNIRSVGSTLVWLAEFLETDTATIAALASSVADSGGVSVVPAFGGLGAPWWDAGAVGIVGGITLGTSRAQVARAALDSIAHQIADVMDRVRISGISADMLYVDGGPTKNALLMQFEADMANVGIFRSETAELSALGAAHMAGLGAGSWSLEDLGALERPGTLIAPQTDEAGRRHLRTQWQSMVDRARGRAVGDDAGT